MASRTSKSLKNVIFGLIGLLCSLVVTFVAKSIFIRLLGVAYNGVNGLFSNILQVLNLAELGFSATIALSLYKPLQDEDSIVVAQLMNYFAKVYRVIALLVCVAGLLCIPFLQYLIAEDISGLPFSLGQLRGYFAMYLASTVCSYLLAYKRTIITADQNSYIVTNVDNVCNILLNVVQIICLIIFENYIVFLAVMIGKTLINNIIIQIIADKKYPYLKKYRKVKLPKEQQRIIIKNVQAMFTYKIGSVIVYSTSSIIISAFVGLLDAGIYSNYLMVVTNVNALVNILFNSMLASIGNLCVQKDRQYQHIVFKRLQYIANFITAFSLCCYICLFNPFIDIWLGEGMVFGIGTVCVISINAAISYIRKAILMFRDATGLFRLDWYKPIIEALVGVALAIGLSYVWGVFGVIAGYTIATISIAIPIETYVLFKHGLQRKVGKQIIEMLVTVLFSGLVAALCYFICTFIPTSEGGLGIGWFVLRFVFVVVFAAGVFILATCRTEEFKYYKNLAAAIIKKVIDRVKFKVGKKQSAAELPEAINKDVARDGESNAIIGNDEKTVEEGTEQQTEKMENDGREDKHIKQDDVQ